MIIRIIVTEEEEEHSHTEDEVVFKQKMPFLLREKTIAGDEHFFSCVRDEQTGPKNSAGSRNARLRRLVDR
jgi:hypothetical protein